MKTNITEITDTSEVKLSFFYRDVQTDGRMMMSIYLEDRKHYFMNNNNNTVAATNWPFSVYLSFLVIIIECCWNTCIHVLLFIYSFNLFIRQKGTVTPNKSNTRFMRCVSPHKKSSPCLCGVNHRINDFESVYVTRPLCGDTVHYTTQIM